MKRSVPAVVLVLGAVLMTSATLIAEAAAPTCQDRLLNNTYVCQVALSTGAASPGEILVFQDGGFSSHFDMFTVLANDVYGCACAPGGTVAHPRFDMGFNFVCAGVSRNLAFTGMVTTRTISAKQVKTDGTTSLYTCTRN